MLSIRTQALPEDSLLAAYARGGAYTDCYVTELARSLPLRDYIMAFYTTPLFRTERLVLKWAVAKPSTDADVQALAEGRADHFAAWDVEQRTSDQLLLRDLYGRTRSWLKVAPGADGHTWMYFGSAVVSRKGTSGMGQPYQALLGFHKLYSMILLASARARLQRGQRQA